MSYYIRNSGKAGWIVVKQSYDKGKRKQKSVPKEIYHNLGFRKSMTKDEAKERCLRLNKEKSRDKWAAVRAANNYKELELVKSIYIPEDLANEFQDWLIENHSLTTISQCNFSPS
jgi:ribosomal protein L15E